MADFAWNDDAVTKLKEGLERGDSFDVVAAEIGCSRNAAIGKAHRVGLKSKNKNSDNLVRKNSRDKPIVSDKFSPRAAAIVRNKVHKARPTSRAERIVHSRECDAETPPIPPEIQEAPIETAAPSTSRTLMQLAANDCRWPFGTPGTTEFRFCGSPTADMARGQPYCLEHADHAYRSRAR